MGASSATDAWSVGVTRPISGGYNGAANSLYEHWNGTAWTTMAGPNIGGLVDVTDFGPGNAWAVSATGNLAQWNGTAWTAVTAPQPNPADTFGDSITSMSADGPNDIWAVGRYTNASYANALYALHYNGTAWSVATLPSPDPNAPSPTLTGVAAISPTDVWAVGDVSTSGTPVIDQVPSGGGKWVIEAPYVIGAADTLGVNQGWTVIVYNLGERRRPTPCSRSGCCPPSLILGLRARDIMGYTVAMFCVLFPAVLVLVTLFASTLGFP